MSDTSTEKTDRLPKGALIFLTTALGLWLHVVGLHFFPIATFVLATSFSLAGAILIPRLSLMRSLQNTTSVEDLGDHGASVAAAFEAAAKRFGRTNAKLLLSEDNTFSEVFARWIPGTTTLVMTRGAYEFPPAEREALWALELAELTSRGFTPLRAVHAFRAVANAATRLALIVSFAGSFGWIDAVLATVLVFCVSRAITTSIPWLAAQVTLRSDRRAIETAACALEDYVQAIAKMRDGISEELSSRESMVKSLDERIERIRS